jgi:hypothetical protein
MAVQTVIQIRRGEDATWTSTNPTLASGEFGLETNTSKIKIGDGSTSWASLPYLIKQTDNILIDDNTISATNTNGNLILSANGTGNVLINGSRIATIADLGSSTTTVGTITTGTWNAGTIQIAYGGTGATDATTARTNLGVAIGTNVQAYSAVLGSVSAGTYTGAASITTVGTITTGTWNGAYSNSNVTAVANGTYAGDDSITTVGTITTGTWNGANVAVSRGGTGANDAVQARTNLGVAIGTNVQAYSAVLGSVSAGTYTGATSITTVGTITTGTWNAGTVAVAYGGTGATDATTARTNLGVAIGTNVQAYSAVLGSVSAGTYTGSTSITTVGTIATGTWNAGTVAVAYGGTGATDATTARTNLGVAIGTNVQAYSAVLGSVSAGTYTGSTSITTVGTIATGTWNGAYSNSNVTAVANGTYAGDDSITTVGTVTTGTWNAGTVAVAYGGTGATTQSGARTNLGLGTISTQDANNVSITGGTITGITNLSVSGNLFVDGTTTTLSSVNLLIEDKNIVLADGNSTDVGADGGGLTLKGTTDKTFTWVDSTDCWTSSEGLNLVSTKDYKIAGTSVLTATVLGSGVVTSSLTTVGTIGTGTWQGATVGAGYGGTGIATYAAGDLLYATAATTLAKLAKGTAYQMLRMNAGATAPEWSNTIDGGTP